ncbi:MAG: aminoacyl-tRNA hydrolase [Verrucomicrobia bacterium]|nr:MAG: aminoacyl-tRNA hydrolase [Verrucomicrobiota bacterium]
MKLIVGLGNPGKQYERTRHNVGFEVLDELARRATVDFRKPWLAKAQTATAQIGGREVLLAKPVTFMNLSGEAVAALVHKRGWQPADVLVVSDDVELPIGRLRIRARGGAGGHNGLKSVIERLGSDDFARLRVGIGRAVGEREMTGHVLGRFSAEERRALEPVIVTAVDAVEGILANGVEAAMNQFNGTTIERK